VEIFDRTVRYQQTIVNFIICPLMGHAVDAFPPTVSIVGMNSVKYRLQGWLNGSIVFKDLVGFLRPVDLSAENVPAEAASVAYALPFS
jgi:hypothetical protein